MARKVGRIWIWSMALLLLCAPVFAKGAGTEAKMAAAGPDGDKKDLAECICMVIDTDGCLPADVQKRAKKLKMDCKLYVATFEEMIDDAVKMACATKAVQSALKGKTDEQKAAIKAKIREREEDKREYWAAFARDQCITFITDSADLEGFLKKLIVAEEVVHTEQNEQGEPYKESPFESIPKSGSSTQQARLQEFPSTGDADADKALKEAAAQYKEVQAKKRVIEFAKKKVQEALDAWFADITNEQKRMDFQDKANALLKYSATLAEALKKMCAALMEPKLGTLPAGKAKDLLDKIKKCKPDATKAADNAGGAGNNAVDEHNNNVPEEKKIDPKKPGGSAGGAGGG